MCKHRILIWIEQAEGGWASDEMECSTCGQTFKFERVKED